MISTKLNKRKELYNYRYKPKLLSTAEEITGSLNLKWRSRNHAHWCGRGREGAEKAELSVGAAVTNTQHASLASLLQSIQAFFHCWCYRLITEHPRKHIKGWGSLYPIVPTFYFLQKLSVPLFLLVIGDGFHQDKSSISQCNYLDIKIR